MIAVTLTIDEAQTVAALCAVATMLPSLSAEERKVASDIGVRVQVEMSKLAKVRDGA